MNDTNEALKRHATHPSVRRRVDQLKPRLFRWIQQNCFAADATAVNIALLEIALEGYLVMSESEEGTRAFMNETLQRIVHKPAGPVQ
jgi:hypothetical protein